MATETEGRREAVKAVGDASDGERVDSATRSKATEWFMSPIEEAVATHDFEINVGGQSKRNPPNYVPITVQVLGRERIREIRREASMPNRSGEDEVNEIEANLKIAVEGLLDPDLSKPEVRRVGGQDFLDPADALSARFAFKPGLIDQIAGEVVKISGYDDKDVREIDVVKG